jgi:hypothetical protein
LHVSLTPFFLFFRKKKKNLQSISITYLVNFREYTSRERESEKKLVEVTKVNKKVVWIEGEEKIKNRVILPCFCVWCERLQGDNAMKEI